jgi:vesicle coat complex subunit
MDILRALNSPNVDICRKTLTVAMDLVSPRNIHEVVQVLKREVVRTQEADMEKGMIYRTLLIQAIHSCATKVCLQCYYFFYYLCSYSSYALHTVLQSTDNCIVTLERSEYIHMMMHIRMYCMYV